MPTFPAPTGGASGRQSEIFLRQAEHCDSRSPLYAGLCRRFAGDARVAALAPDLRWDYPLRLLGGLHFLVLGGEASWDDVDGALEEHAAFLARFVAEQRVQTNEVGRAWALLPGVLSTDAERVELIELGTSAGLLLGLDRYAYRYRAGRWGDGGPELSGDDRGGPPAGLLGRRLEVAARRGLDLDPVDATSPDAARLLEAWVWPGQAGRSERLHAAIEALRRDPPEIVCGDYVELLPDELARRRGDALTVVFSSLSTGYLAEERYQILVRALARAARDAPIAWLALEAVRHDPRSPVVLELTLLPGGERRRLAEVDPHGAWLEWLGW